MKKLLCVFLLIIFIGGICFASEIQDVQCFFNRYVEAANSYNTNYFDFYSNDAKIIRVVEKPDGTFESVNVPLERYKSEAKKSTALMKLRKYKNRYYIRMPLELFWMVFAWLLSTARGAGKV